jgi:cardiolipin synthase A/B
VNPQPDSGWLQLLVLTLGAGSALLGAGHALLTKRDPRSAAVWVSLCLFFPLLGVLLYLAIGNNRIRTRAQRLHVAAPPWPQARQPEHADAERLIAPEYRNLAYLGRGASGNELLTGNRVDAFFMGESAYPAMLEAIGAASRFVYLSSYIFESRGIGEEFVTALAAACARGVQVRVLLDGFGELYSLPRCGTRLRAAGIPYARFLPPQLLPPNFWINLRNHRKLLVVDGEIAFTGGMNIRSKHMALPGRPAGVLDIHFRLQGPIVAQIEAVFRADWMFCARETLPLPMVPAVLDPDGAECRVIVDGPNEDLDRMLWVMVGAISLARDSIRIMTPYFLPPRELAVALQIAALRGVDVSVILPRNNNFVFMTWAAMHGMGYLLKAGVKVYFQDGVFQHSKLFLIDDYYAQIGSSNLDPRSLRLNFEIAVEVYDREFGRQMSEHFAAALTRAPQLEFDAWRERRLPRRLRDAIFWLLSPYL